MTAFPRSVPLDQVDFASLVRPGDTVMWSQGAAEPSSLLERLLAQREHVGHFRIFVGGSFADTLRPEHADRIGMAGLGAVGTNRELCARRLMDVHPVHLSALPALLADGSIRVDVVLMQFGPADAAGRHGPGVANGYVQYALPRARVAIAEINAALPRTTTSAPVDLSRFDLTVEVDRAPVEIGQKQPGEIDRRVARAAARFIGDDSVLQIGIGTVPAAILAELGDRRHLGLHAGVIGDAVLPLLRSGAIDNSSKSVARGFTVTGALAGSAELYRFADENPALRLEPVEHTHSISTLARIDRLVAVNSAVEVDVTGQVGSEVAGSSYVGTVGGQVDFVRGAMASKGGRSLICLPSRTAGGRPRIVPRLGSGVVTVPRADADVIITEHGAAELRGQPLSERVRRMISIAQPEDRETLERAAREGVIGAAG